MVELHYMDKIDNIHVNNMDEVEIIDEMNYMIM